MPGFNISNTGGQPVNNASVPVRQDYYLSYCWEVPLVFGNTTSTDTTLLMLKDATLPTFTVVKDSYVGASVEYKYAKSVVWDDIKLTWYDTKGLLKYMSEWRSSIWTRLSGLKPAAEYKKVTTLSHFLPDYSEKVRFSLYGSWPSQIRHGDLTYTSTEAKLIEVTVSYDTAEEFEPIKP